VAPTHGFISGYVLDGDDVLQHKIKISTQKGRYRFSDHRNHPKPRYTNALSPYFEWFENGRPKYAIITESVSSQFRSNLYLKDVTGKLVRVVAHDLVILNQNGELVEAYPINTLYGMYEAFKIIKRQVAEYGWN